MRCIFALFFAALLMVAVAHAELSTVQSSRLNPILPQSYQSSETCSNCHTRLYEQFEHSMHARAFDNPVFQYQFYDVLLPQMVNDNDSVFAAAACLKCHSPTTFLTQDLRLPARDAVDKSLPGVTCDFCHTLTGYTGPSPGNANYRNSPGPIKYGPLQFSTDWHRAYSQFQRQSEICAVCHEATNRFGVPIHTTYSEWRASAWPNRGIVCQDCHMSASGRLVAGKPVFDSGVLAVNTLITPKEREKIYSHRFPGARIDNQLYGAVKLQVHSFPERLRPGQTMFVGIELDNSEAGHSMPTGAIELRMAWLDVRLRMQDKEWQLKAKPAANMNWDVAGANPADKALNGTAISPGSRLYRAILVDREGQPTLNKWEAVDKVFDNRLQAGEERRELFSFTLPADASGSLEVDATLRYLRYPPGTEKRLGIDTVDSVLVAKANKIIQVSH
ncbi:MAG: hypothetical protein KZQ73_05680 [Candidatus Thiodiazotropha sp. (ex Semelilucina semeliformis)]|nr:hypothetical protein [Candidatus Thiodiazotropha sp. (ex Semelilucina semeliformis)]